MDQALNQKIDAYIAQNKEQLLKDIAALVAVNSVEGTPEEGAPYGAGPRAALDKTLELAAGMGLATRNCENYIGYAELAGKDPEKYLATICHVDVVPVGNGWTADPFTMRIQDGWLLGRGVADDKGPMVATLYALKFLKEQGYELRYPIRALAGTNEETHMQDVDYYLKNYPAPAFCFTPDAEFPVCNGEKGGFNGEIVSPKLDGIITAFEGGVAHNAVPDRASCTVQVAAGALVQTEGVTFEAGESGSTIIRGWGKSGHAAMPEGTVNAISLIVDCLLKSGVCTPQEDAYLQVLHTLHSAGLVLAVVSNSSVEVVDGALQQCGIRPYFQQIFSGWQIPQCKPDPYLYRQAMQAFGLSPETCLVVEDSPVGIRAGRGAGLPVAALRDRDGLIDQSEADVVLPTIQSLLQLPCVQQCICN